MGIFFALLAAVLASISNLALRKSIDAGGSSKGYLVIQVTFSFLVMILLNPVRTGDYAWSWPAVVVGLVGGILFGLLMWGIGKTLEKGPAGLSFAILNTSSVMPGIVLALLFGINFGHSYSLTNAIGSILVAIGLFWAGWTSEESSQKGRWIFFASLIFFLHLSFLVFLQWWAMILKPLLPKSLLIPFHTETVHTQWFMPVILFVGALIQWVAYLKNRESMPKGSEISYGVLGGIANGACTFFLILAPQVSTPFENAMIFPIYSVSIIVICNGWAQMIYKEKVNWWANSLCLIGLFVGTLSWQAIFVK